MVKVTVSTPLHATEVAQRVQEAATAFWPDVQLHEEDGRLVGAGADLETFRSRVWELRIIDAVRGQLLDGCRGAQVRFALSKQAALSNRISFPPSPHALGDVVVTLTVDEEDPWEDAEALVWWLCPETADGEIVQGSHK